VVARFVDENDDSVDKVVVDDGRENSSSAAGKAFAEAVKGKAVPSAEIERELARLADAEAQARAYKITTMATTTTTATSKKVASASSPPVEVGPLPDAVACRIAVRDC